MSGLLTLFVRWGKRKFRIFAAQNGVINNLNFTTMAFNFNGIKATSVASYTAQMYIHLIPLSYCDAGLEEAKKQGNVAMQFYYYFLKRLYEAASPNLTSIPRELVYLIDQKPVNTLKGLWDIAKFDQKYFPNDVDAVRHVIEVMQTTSVVK